MENENENLDSENQEEIIVDENDDSEALKEKFDKVSNTNKQLFERAKKAETEAKELKKFKADAEARVEANEKKAETEKPNEPDYGKLAYLQARGIDNSDDQKIVQDEANRLKLPLTDVLGMEHIQSKLKSNKEEREAKAGMPRGGNRSGGANQHDVEYWVAKGGLPEEQELAEKVVDARMGKEKKNKFSDTLYNE